MTVEPGDKKPGGRIQGLVCPETHLALEPAPAEQVARLVELQGSGELRTITGQAVEGVPTGAWIRSDGALLYLVIDGISRMVTEDAVSLEEEGPAGGS